MDHQSVARKSFEEPAATESLLRRLEKLNAIGIALSAEKDITRLLEEILIAAKTVTHADGGTLYRIDDNRALHFEILHNDSLGIAMGGTSGVPIPFEPLPLYDLAGNPNNTMVAAHAVLADQTINIEDAYTAQGFDFSGTRAFDSNTGYRSQSFLTIPMKNHDNETNWVLQLINARSPQTGAIIAFTETDQKLAESLASQAAIALTNRLLINQLTELFESLVRLINTAIDQKSPYTGGHCQRVPVLSMMLADAASETEDGPLADFYLSEKDHNELRIAAMLHDCGKITTPVHVVDKATKLESIFDRIHLIDTRFEILRRDAEIRLLHEKIEAIRNNASTADLEQRHEAAMLQLDDDQAFLRNYNSGSEFMPPEQQARVDAIAAKYTWVDGQGQTIPLLSEDEAHNLKIAAGTLTQEERDVINHHVVASIQMLEALPWPKDLRNVPAYAGAHHERMDGKGYPNGLTRDQMPLPARIVAIADIFEALTAGDRPYKSAKKLSEALHILGKMKLSQHIDPDLFDLFIRRKIYAAYAEAFLRPEQIDTVDPNEIPGFTP